jgi:hypothetical protein
MRSPSKPLVSWKLYRCCQPIDSHVLDPRGCPSPPWHRGASHRSCRGWRGAGAWRRWALCPAIPTRRHSAALAFRHIENKGGYPRFCRTARDRTCGGVLFPVFVSFAAYPRNRAGRAWVWVGRPVGGPPNDDLNLARSPEAWFWQDLVVGDQEIGPQLPRLLDACAVAERHHFVAALAFARTIGSVSSATRLTSQIRMRSFSSTTKSGS